MSRGDMSRLFFLTGLFFFCSTAHAETCGGPTSHNFTGKLIENWSAWLSCEKPSDCTVIDNRDWHCVNNLMGEPFIPISKPFIEDFCQHHRLNQSVSSSSPSEALCGKYLRGSKECEGQARKVLDCVALRCELKEKLPAECYHDPRGLPNK